ncbi:MAG TPA: thiamine phosphate synthase [Caulobacteraceae bacterium]|nr:thiamine phosphate synthase [Caulobacteraceae bacterium]
MGRMDLDRLWSVARGLRPRVPPRKPLPKLLFVTDPARTPDIEAIAGRLPRGAGIVFRAFGAPDAAVQAARLARIARRRGLTLLAGADEALAIDGLHLPERMIPRLPRLRARHRRWIITAAAHSAWAIRAAKGADAVLVSPVFESASPSAGKPLGPHRLAALVRLSPVPVYALGGVNMKNARRLRATGVYGIAAVEAFVPRT